MLKTTIHTKRHGINDKLNLTVDFNGHADDAKAVWRASMNELKKRKPNIMGYVQRIEVRKD